MHTHRILRSSAALAAVAVLASACGSSGTAATTTAAGDAGYPAAGSGQAGVRPGASGTIAAVSGRVVQVQSDTSGQVAVTVTSKTVLTDQVDASRSAVKVGSCVVVRPSTSGTSTSTTAVTASSVGVTAASGSSCAGGFAGGGGPGGGRPTGMPTGMPSDVPSGMPSGMPTDDGGRGFGVIGKVTAISAHGFTVASSMPGSSGSSTAVTVTTTASTTYTAQQKASLDALKVGRCLQATGSTDATGAVTATRAAVSDAVDGSCTSGFGGGQRGSAS